MLALLRVARVSSCSQQTASSNLADKTFARCAGCGGQEARVSFRDRQSSKCPTDREASRSAMVKAALQSLPRRFRAGAGNTEVKVSCESTHTRSTIKLTLERPANAQPISATARWALSLSTFTSVHDCPAIVRMSLYVQVWVFCVYLVRILCVTCAYCVSRPSLSMR